MTRPLVQEGAAETMSCVVLVCPLEVTLSKEKSGEQGQCNWERKDDDHDQDPFPRHLLDMIGSWPSDNALLRKRTMSMTNIPSRKSCYTHGHGPPKTLSNP